MLDYHHLKKEIEKANDVIKFAKDSVIKSRPFKDYSKVRIEGNDEVFWAVWVDWCSTRLNIMDMELKVVKTVEIYEITEVVVSNTERQ